jgi:hypothetical protein
MEQIPEISAHNIYAYKIMFQHKETFGLYSGSQNLCRMTQPEEILLSSEAIYTSIRPRVNYSRRR